MYLIVMFREIKQIIIIIIIMVKLIYIYARQLLCNKISVQLMEMLLHKWCVKLLN